MNTKLPLGFELIMSDNPIEYASNNQLKSYSVIMQNSDLQSDTMIDIHFIINDLENHILLFIGILATHSMLKNIDKRYQFDWPNTICFDNNIIAKCKTHKTNILHIQIKPIISKKNIIIKICHQIHFFMNKLKMINKKQIENEMKNLIIRKKDKKNETVFYVNNIDEKGNLQIIDKEYKSHELLLSDFICSK
ncbi:hypothetical protein FZC35_00925 [Candidatus Cytomitobacter indipagum]|uniref:Uncharacterized protein n=1 Tax=Candidatus Cytomitobacter indipagum TaxID=2601575 RepID=A0A5C0UFX3_9PROT|nr:hypothetical protein [Candidatus Cytomitobacter indipagum]QEK37944.1 hypothetical protein FZC35_00925 [Candidatus Cytomitobacter indipagum]